MAFKAGPFRDLDLAVCAEVLKSLVFYVGEYFDGGFGEAGDLPDLERVQKLLVRGFLPKLSFSRAKRDHKAGVFDGWGLFPCK